jgi:hypothetical protein
MPGTANPSLDPLLRAQAHGITPHHPIPQGLDDLLKEVERLESEREEKAREAAFFALEKHVVEIDEDKDAWPIDRIVNVVLDAYVEAKKNR